MDTRDDTAEGSRETVETNLDQHGEGISNRGIDAEAEQATLPPRGKAQDDASARKPTDVGRTSGGGNLGHGHPDGES